MDDQFTEFTEEVIDARSLMDVTSSLLSLPQERAGLPQRQGGELRISSALTYFGRESKVVLGDFAELLKSAAAPVLSSGNERTPNGNGVSNLISSDTTRQSLRSPLQCSPIAEPIRALERIYDNPKPITAPSISGVFSAITSSYSPSLSAHIVQSSLFVPAFPKIDPVASAGSTATLAKLAICPIAAHPETAVRMVKDAAQPVLRDIPTLTARLLEPANDKDKGLSLLGLRSAVRLANQSGIASAEKVERTSTIRRAGSELAEPLLRTEPAIDKPEFKLARLLESLSKYTAVSEPKITPVPTASIPVAPTKVTLAEHRLSENLSTSTESVVSARLGRACTGANANLPLSVLDEVRKLESNPPNSIVELNGTKFAVDMATRSLIQPGAQEKNIVATIAPLILRNREPKGLSTDSIQQSELPVNVNNTIRPELPPSRPSNRSNKLREIQLLTTQPSLATEVSSPKKNDSGTHVKSSEPLTPGNAVTSPSTVSGDVPSTKSFVRTTEDKINLPPKKSQGGQSVKPPEIISTNSGVNSVTITAADKPPAAKSTVLAGVQDQPLVIAQKTDILVPKVITGMKIAASGNEGANVVLPLSADILSASNVAVRADISLPEGRAIVQDPSATPINTGASDWIVTSGTTKLLPAIANQGNSELHVASEKGKKDKTDKNEDEEQYGGLLPWFGKGPGDTRSDEGEEATPESNHLADVAKSSYTECFVFRILSRSNHLADVIVPSTAPVALLNDDLCDLIELPASAMRYLVTRGNRVGPQTLDSRFVEESSTALCDVVTHFNQRLQFVYEKRAGKREELQVIPVEAVLAPWQA